MVKPRLLVISMLVLATVAAARGQTYEITLDSNPSSAEIVAWLNGDDARLVAWGAHFASRSSDEAAVTAMIRVVERWRSSSRSDDATRYRREAMLHVLDALIQRNEAVPAAGLAVIAPEFSTQAAILAARLPASEATPLLESWFEENPSAHSLPLDRIAAMLLAKAPPPEFAARVLAEAEERLAVYVVDKAGYGSGSGGGGCADGGGGAPRKGWPPLFLYIVEENRPKKDNDPVLVEGGGDRITFRRLAATGGIGSCYGVKPLNAETRYALISDMLGGDVQWKVQESVSIVWKGPQQFSADLRREIAAHESKLRMCVSAFAARKLVSQSEADSVRPKLEVSVEDARKKSQADLPKISSPDPRTTISYSKSE